MPLDRPNVLFLSIDALRADRSSVTGYDRPTTPNLAQLVEEAWVCDQAVSMGGHTQVSFHSFMSSSLPYSYGGYDRGAEGRPATLFKALHDGGYETISIATFPWITRYLGYNDGAIDRENFTFILNAFVGLYGSGTMASALRSWHKGEISLERALELVGPWVLKVFDHSESYCKERQAQDARNRLDFKNAGFLREGFDYDRVLKSIVRHRHAYLRDPAGYMEKHLTEVPHVHNWIGHEWRTFCRKPLKLIEEVWSHVINRLIGMFSPRQAAFRKHRYKRYVDSSELANRILREIKDREKPDQPFFLWTHFFDTHVPYCPGSLPGWHHSASNYLERLGYPRDMDLSVGLGGKPETPEEWEIWSALYDAAVLYVDEQVGQILQGLDEMGLREDTLIVICGDHGEELGEHGDISHHFRLHEHNIRVPLIFYRPGMKAQRINSLVTLLDLAPTIAHLAGIEPADDWVGEVVNSAAVAERENIVIETFHGGNCLFDKRPLYMAIRTPKWKYLWKEYIDPTDRFSPAQYELYDITVDPLEQNNLYVQGHPMVERFNPLILERLREVPEISKERIAAISANLNVCLTPMAAS